MPLRLFYFSVRLITTAPSVVPVGTGVMEITVFNMVCLLSLCYNLGYKKREKVRS